MEKSLQVITNFTQADCNRALLELGSRTKEVIVTMDNQGMAYTIVYWNSDPLPFEDEYTA